jgi:hypothetical protein
VVIIISFFYVPSPFLIVFRLLVCFYYSTRLGLTCFEVLAGWQANGYRIRAYNLRALQESEQIDVSRRVRLRHCRNVILLIVAGVIVGGGGSGQVRGEDGGRGWRRQVVGGRQRGFSEELMKVLAMSLVHDDVESVVVLNEGRPCCFKRHYTFFHN